MAHYSSGVIRSFRGPVSLRRFIPLTLPGLLVTGLAAIGFAVGRVRMDLVLTLTGLWGLVFVALTGFTSLIALARWRRAVLDALSVAGQGPLTGVEGFRIVTGLYLPLRRIPLAAPPEWRWLQPETEVQWVRDGSNLREEITPRERRIGDEVVRELAIGDLFGIWRLRWRVSQARPLLIAPNPGRLSASDLLTCLSSGDSIPYPLPRAAGDRVDQRPYTLSDPARLILWKVYARSRELLVRTPEPARTPERKPLVYLVTGPADDAAAGAARVLLESHTLGKDVPFACDGTPIPVTAGDEIRHALALSRDHRERGGRDLAAALADRRLDADAPVLLIVPGLPGPWHEPVWAAVRQQPTRFLVLAVGDLRPASVSWPGSWRHLQRLLFSAETAPLTLERLRGEATGFLQRGCTVLVADRVGGRVLSGSTG